MSPNPTSVFSVSLATFPRITRNKIFHGRGNEVCWCTLRCAFKQNRLLRCLQRGTVVSLYIPCSWQQTSCILPEQHSAHTLPSAVALTNPGLTWPNLVQLGPLQPKAYENPELIEKIHAKTNPFLKSCMSAHMHRCIEGMRVGGLLCSRGK